MPGPCFFPKVVMLCREHDGNEEGKSMGRTWNRDMTPSERLLALYSMLLFSGRTVSLTELSRELACSKQTVRRLVDQLEASPFGRILRSMHGREVMYRMERPATLPKISLDPEGLQQLALCRAFLCHLLPETMQRTMEAALQQASAYLPAGEMLGDAEEIGRALAKGPIDYAPFQQDLQTLIDAIGRRRVCVVTYRAVSGAGEKRHFFAPQKLLAYHESLYVHGWMVSEKGRAEPLYDSPTNLALHRMTSVRMTRRSCEGVGREEDDTEGCFGLMGCRPFTVRVRFAASSAADASERRWSRDQKLTRHRDGSVTLTMTARSEAEVVAWVLSFADTAELLAPHRLREKVAGCVARLSAMYAGAAKTGEAREPARAASSGPSGKRGLRPEEPAALSGGEPGPSAEGACSQ